MSIETKHNYYQEKLRGTSYILCKELAAAYLNLSNVNINYNIDYYEDSADVDFIEILGILQDSNVLSIVTLGINSTRFREKTVFFGDVIYIIESS